jgi:uncharacterized protein Veg
MENYGDKRQLRVHYPVSDCYPTVFILNKLQRKKKKLNVDAVTNLCFPILFLTKSHFSSGIFVFKGVKIGA